jgi:hypothetical protein
MLLRHGNVVAEGWWSPYAADRPHILFSLSKSFASTGIGLAVAEGRLSVEDKVLSFFPEEAPEKIDDNLAAMRVRDLLCMSTGHQEDATGRMAEHASGNWVKGFLSLPVEHEPGSFFVYNSAATYMLSAIVTKVTGMKLIDYLQPRLFDPLGIHGATWEESPQGINIGGWGLKIKTEDIARFGQMYLQKGVWNGKRILPEAWVAQASSPQAPFSAGGGPDWKQGYGYQFWRCQHNAYRGDGAFGQYCIVMPDQDAVLAITSGVQDMQSVLDLVWKHLLPAMQPVPLPDDLRAQKKLAAKIAGLALQPPAGAADSPLTAQVSGKRITFEANEAKTEQARLDLSAAGCTLTARVAGEDHHAELGAGKWKEGVTDLFGEGQEPAVGSGVWTAEDTYQATLRFTETPFYQTMTFHFSGSQVTLDTQMNVSFGPNAMPKLVGKIEG